MFASVGLVVVGNDQMVPQISCGCISQSIPGKLGGSEGRVQTTAGIETILTLWRWGGGRSPDS